MIEIYPLHLAKETILQRVPFNQQQYPKETLSRLEAIFGPGARPETAVLEIIQSVVTDGDQALFRWTGRLDKVRLDSLQIEPDDLEAAYQALPTPLKEALNKASERIRIFHQQQPIPSWTTNTLGGTVGQRFTPIQRIGIYVPGGSAPLPSSLLMTAIPAQVAGVEKIVVCTPPNPDPVILAAAKICGLREVYTVGGAQAIAAMAYGTESVPKVDKIIGAGNLFVTLAKQQVYGVVGLDGLFGPTETVIIADDTANHKWIAADLLAQAEHDALASAILLTPHRPLADAVQVELNIRLTGLSREKIIRQSFQDQGGIVIVPDLETAARVADAFAPEHLCLSVKDPQSLASRIKNAGGLFLGEHSFEVLGDYIAGPSHIMPTGGTARFASPLNVLDFLKLNSIIALDEETADQLSPSAGEIARAETLTAHAAAAESRVIVS